MPAATEVICKQLGRTAVSIPAIGFGAWQYSGGEKPLATAVANGAAFIDTAETYGSEELIGQILRGHRSQMFLATKVRPANFRRADILKAADASLRRLQTDYVDLYQLHWPNYTVPIEETMNAMEDLVDAGKVRFIGVSNFSVEELRTAQASLLKYSIVSNQLKYSLIERTVESGLLHYCQQNGISIIAFSPLASDFSQIRSSDPTKLLPKFAKSYTRTEAQVAVNWLIRKDGVVAIPKASTVEHVTEDCGAMGWRLSDHDAALLSSNIRYRCRGELERAVRKLGRRVLQTCGQNL